MADTTSPAGRPVSPHLSIYRPLINMMMSIVHRITGMGLYFGMIGLAAWLIAAASGPEAYATVSAVLGSIPGLLIMIGFTWALIHHLLGGIRHLIWDTGAAFSIPAVDTLSWLTIIGSLALTLVLWLAVWAFGAI